MYSGSTLTPLSGVIFGAHQKIDRTARTQLEALLPGVDFPDYKTILHFEGNNGPDGVKRKSPAKDEPWHFVQPFDAQDTRLIELIEYHYKELVRSLQEKDNVRAAFEASWLAHTVVDGLTPAHHYPYEERLVELSNGRGGNETRTSIAKKLIMPGDTFTQMIANNWNMWGPRGLMTSHGVFEVGFAVILKSLKLDNKPPKEDQIKHFEAHSIGEWFRQTAQDIARMELYDDFHANGWSLPLTRRMRRELAPAIVQAVTLVWYGACIDAKLVKK